MITGRVGGHRARKLSCVGPFENLMDSNQGPFNDVSDTPFEHENRDL